MGSSTESQLSESVRVDGLMVEVRPDRTATGRLAGRLVAQRLRDAQQVGGGARVAFASAPSQDDMLAALAGAGGIDWSNVTAFHIDEYVGLGRENDRSFARYLDEHLFDIVRPGRVHYIDARADPDAECRRYAGLWADPPIDVCCLGIGENGHLAFNDPPHARLDDEATVKVVQLDVASRRQQVHDGLWAHLDDVPRRAVTLTVPALLSARQVVCTVPGARKRDAVRRALSEPVSAAVPASALRTHADAVLVLDRESWPGAPR